VIVAPGGVFCYMILESARWQVSIGARKMVPDTYKILAVLDKLRELPGQNGNLV
jgi:hypothetical protein